MGGGAMKKRTILALAAGMAILIGITTEVYAWTGEAWWHPTHRACIRYEADQMINRRWTPKNTIKNWMFGTTYYTFNKGAYYTGEAYTQGPQQDIIEFETSIANTPGGTTKYGNDCAGFVSICWLLPSRYTTTNFESDATLTGGYVSSLGNKGTAKTTLLLFGDALVKSGDHIVLVKEKISSGMKTMEQTPPKAMSRDYTWSQLSSYRPIRRNNMAETLYSGFMLESGSVESKASYYNVSGALLGTLAGPANADFDLVLCKWNGLEWDVVQQSNGNSSSETIYYFGPAALYKWIVISYSGSGTYVLSCTKNC